MSLVCVAVLLFCYARCITTFTANSKRTATVFSFPKTPFAVAKPATLVTIHYNMRRNRRQEKPDVFLLFLFLIRIFLFHNLPDDFHGVLQVFRYLLFFHSGDVGPAVIHGN